MARKARSEIRQDRISDRSGLVQDEPRPVSGVPFSVSVSLSLSLAFALKERMAMRRRVLRCRACCDLQCLWYCARVILSCSSAKGTRCGIHIRVCNFLAEAHERFKPHSPLRYFRSLFEAMSGQKEQLEQDVRAPFTQQQEEQQKELTAKVGSMEERLKRPTVLGFLGASPHSFAAIVLHSARRARV